MHSKPKQMMTPVTLCSVVCILALLVTPGLCVNCVTRDQCSCVFDDGSGMVDLTDLGRTDGMPAFYDVPSALDSAVYSYNPCHTFVEGLCESVSVCRFDYFDYTYADLGAVTSTEFSYDGTDVTATYKSADGSRTSQVRLVCDQMYTTPIMEVYGEESPSHFTMTVTSSEACPKAAPPGFLPDTGGGLSGGSILLIIVFVLIVVYLVGGVLFTKYRRGASGKELVPNLGFWTDVPGLIKDGFLFTVNKTCRRGRENYNAI